MHTRMIKIDENTLEQDAVDEVSAILRRGGIVALPTETVYGLAADACNEDAVRKIFAAKGRPGDNPLIVHIAELSELAGLVADIPPQARALAAHFWPGPLTVVLRKSARVPYATSANLDTVGIRMPSHPVIRAVMRASGLALAAPSANRSGRPSPTTARDCAEDLDGRVDAIVTSGGCTVGVESTVLSLCGEVPRLLRPGAVTYEQLCGVLGQVEVDTAVLERSDPASAVSAPGMKYKHYAPKAHVQLVLGESADYCSYVASRAGEGVMALCFRGEEGSLPVPALALGAQEEPGEIARTLFSALRECDRKGAKTVYAHCPAPSGVGLAVYNRLIRAAAFDVTRL